MYPLNSDENESERLNSQLELLEGDWLSSLFHNNSGNLLDVGCGTGHLFKKILPTWSYTGIDTTDRFERTSPDQVYLHQDILEHEPKHKYDIIVCRLVLWSLPEVEKVLKKLSSFSHEKTYLYCYEPDDRHLEFSPELSAVSILAENWQSIVIPQGSNPFIGGELETLLRASGWKVGALKIHDHSYESDHEKFESHLENLVRIFSQSNPAPQADLIRNANAAISASQGSFKERYIEMIGLLSSVTDQ